MVTEIGARALSRAAHYREQKNPESTVLAYTRDVDRYIDWCAKAGFSAFPASPVVVGAYLAEHGAGFAYNTLVRWVAGIAWRARRDGEPLDTKAPEITEVLNGIGLVEGTKARRAAAVTTDEMALVVSKLGTDLTGLRDRALLLVGFGAALRRSELAALDVSDVHWTNIGLELTIDRSKTDQKREGATVAVVLGQNPETCAVSALRTWLERAKIQNGPLFRKVARGGHVQENPLTGGAIWKIVTARFRAAKLTAPKDEYLSPHSLRAGFVTSAYVNDASDEEIMHQTRHKSLTTMRGYVRRAKLRAGGASGKVGL